MVRKKYLKIISTDSVGLFGHPDQFIDLYQEYFKKKILDGVEAVAFRPINKLRFIISTLKKANIKVVSLHGRTGGEWKYPPIYAIMIFFVNKTLLNIKQTLSSFPEQDILIHTPYAELPFVQKSILNSPPKTLILENHRLGKPGIQDAIKLIKYFRINNINTIGLIDIYHYIYNFSTKEIKTHWLKILNELEEFFKLTDGEGRPLFTAVHFPIGTRISDSLPFDEMDDKMLVQFAEKICPYLDRFVIENQVKEFGLIYLTKSMIKKLKNRNEINIQRLIKAGIL